VILVTGASGNVGAEVTRAVLAAGHPVRALSRQSSAAGIPAGAGIVPGDLSDRSSLRPAFAGVDAVFLLAGYPDVAGLLADMRAAGAGRVVLLSTGAVAGGDLDNAVVRFNVVSEAAVRDSGLDWTVLRPSGFMSNTLQWIPQLRAGDTVREPFADVPIATIDPCRSRLCAERVAARGWRLLGHDLAGRPKDPSGRPWSRPRCTAGVEAPRLPPMLGGQRLPGRGTVLTCRAGPPRCGR
jgi:uncharacterized protein YbjT (DUF2867 family)